MNHPVWPMTVFHMTQSEMQKYGFAGKNRRAWITDVMRLTKNYLMVVAGCLHSLLFREMKPGHLQMTYQIHGIS